MTIQELFYSIHYIEEEIENAIDNTQYHTGVKGVNYDGAYTTNKYKQSDTVFSATADNLSKEEYILTLWNKYNNLLQMRRTVFDEIEKQRENGTTLSFLLLLVGSCAKDTVIRRELCIKKSEYVELYNEAIAAANDILQNLTPLPAV